MRVMKKMAAVMIAMMTVIAVAGTSIPAEAAAKAPKKITLKTTSKTVDLKGKATVSVKSVTPKGADKSVKYQTSDKKIAAVSAKGEVTGKKAGNVTITAISKKDKKVKATVKIAVKDLKPSSISLKSAVTMTAGSKQTLKAAVKPAGVYCPVTWTSDNKSVAAVDKNGKVTAKKKGTAVITVKTKEKNSKGKSLTKKCKVTVKAKEVKVSGLSFAEKEKSVFGPDGNYTNKLTVSPSNATNKKVTYTSSKPEVATVDASSGKVTAVATGEAVITAAAADGSGKKASYKLVVSDWQRVSSADLLADKDQYIIIDLRPTKDQDPSIASDGYETGHIPGSVWVPAWPVNTPEKEAMLKASYVLDQVKENGKKVAFICRSGQGGARNAISVMINEGIDPSRLYIQTGGGKDLIANHLSQLETGTGEAFSGDLVISAAELKQKIDAKETLTLVDTRGIGKSDKTAAGAITMSWPMISNMPGPGKAGHARPLSAADISKKLGGLGLGLEDQIILFSAGHASGGWGDDGRIAWQLLQCGYSNVKMVNGGLSAMEAAGIKTQAGPSRATAKAVTVAAVDTTTHDITTEALLAKFSEYKIVDVRANAEYEGAVLYGEASGGHIKGALHIRFTDMFKYDGTLKSNSELDGLFAAAGLKKEDKIVTYCTGGIRSAYMQLVLQMLGYENSYNYAESAYRWSNTKEAGTADYWDSEPVVTGIRFAKATVTTDPEGNRLTAPGATAAKNEMKSFPSQAASLKASYTSSDEKVATVAADGTVTVVSYGEAVITARTDKGLEASYTVVVKDRKDDAINWQSKSPEDCIKEAAAGTLVVVDTRPASIPNENDKGDPQDVGYDAGHIKGSVWVDSWPVGTKKAEDALRAKANELKATGKAVAIVCRSGAGGAKRAISVLKDAGIDESKLFILTGGGTALIKDFASQLEGTAAQEAKAAALEESKEAVNAAQDEAAIAEEKETESTGPEEPAADLEEQEVISDAEPDTSAQ